MANLYNNLETQDEKNVEIRLVTLDGIEEATGEVICRLETVRLNDAALGYRALSYCWGDPEPPSFVKCNGLRLRVTRGLTAAMESLLRNRNQKLESGARTFWIDAICINQGNIQEREKQVTLMGDIYRDAKEVVVWLGLAAANSDLAFRVCERLCAEKLRRDTGMASAREIKYKEARGPYWSTKESYAHIMVNERGKLSRKGITNYIRELDAIQAILTRPWWTRIWIVQEITLARELVVLCGGDSINWRTLEIGITACMRRPFSEDFVSSATFHYADMLFQIRRAVIHHEGSVTQPSYSLAHLLGRFRWSKATNGRDKVYGLLGLATIGKDNPLGSVSYSGDIKTCYRKAVIDVINSSGSLDILQLCRKPPSSGSASADLSESPSWVPNLQLDAGNVDPIVDLSQLCPIGLQSWPDADKFCAVSNPWSEQWRLLCFSATGGSFSDHVECGDDGILTTTGFTLDQIQTIGEMETGARTHRNPLFHQQYLGIRKVMTEAEDIRSVIRTAIFRAKKTCGASRATVIREQSLHICKTLAETDIVRAATQASLTGLRGIFQNFCRFGRDKLRLTDWKRLAFSQGGSYPTGETLSQAFIGTIYQGSLGPNPDEMMARYEEEWSRIFGKIDAVDRGIPGKWLKTHSRLRSALACLVWMISTLSKDEMLESSGNAMYKCFTVTRQGYFALVPPETREGDTIALLKGGPVPFVLRKASKHTVPGWEMIGPCYVHGVMHGGKWTEEGCQPIYLV